jgi:hypothetical protein
MFGSIDIKTRPLKLAYLVDPNNGNQVRDAVRLSSTLWGGHYFPIIPLYKRMPATWRDKPLKAPPAKNVVLGYVEAFDPDVFVQLSNEVPAFITEIGLEVIKPEEIWRVLDDDRSLSPQFGVGIFELLNDIFHEYFKFKRKYPIRIVFPEIPRELSLFWASLFGEIPLKLLPLLQKNYFEPLEIQDSGLKTETLKELLTGNVLFPRRITQHGLKSHSRSGFHRDASIFFLDATKVEDIIDFWNLRALGRKVVPLPKQLQADHQLKEIVIDFLKANRIPWRHNPKVCDFASFIRSRNSTMDEMQEYAKTIKIDRDANDRSDSPFFALQHWYPRVWDEWARDKDGAVSSDIYGTEEDSIEIADTKELRIGIHSLLPQFAAKYGYHGEPRCANEITFHFYGPDEYVAQVFPKSSGENFSRAISGLTSIKGDWRIGRNGLVKIVKNDFNESRDIPLAEKVFFAWLTDLGWKPKLSPPGILAKQIYKQMEGHPSILTEEKVLGLLEHMNGGSVKRDGSPVEENKINQERELPVSEVKSRIGAISQGRTHDYLVSKGIFKLGLRIQCIHCLRNSWFPLDSVRDIFICPKCLNSFQAVGNLDGATWCYKTTGPFSVPNYADGAYAVLLTINFFDRRLHSMQITPALSFEAEASNKENIETDVAAFWQESTYGERKDGLLFGECKTYGRFGKKDFDRISYLAKLFPGSVLVFSTLRKALTSNEIAGIKRIAKAGRKYWKSERPVNPVLILTGNELLGGVGPPYCWEDSIKEKFKHLAGFLSLCDATQQIYLNLSPWEIEWHEKWEKRRRRQTQKRPLNAA